jgi:S1-C subfamily serine protease
MLLVSVLGTTAETTASLSQQLAALRPSDLGLLDVVLVLVAVLVAAGGARSGLLARVAAWVGLLAGFVLAGRTVPLVLGTVASAGLPARTFLAVMTLTATISLTGVVVQVASAPLRRMLTLGPLTLIDRALGAIASVVALAVLLWLLIPSAAAVPGRISSEVRASAVLTGLDAATPTPPDVTRALRTLLGGDRFPEVFATLAPTPIPSPPPTSTALAPDVLDRAVRASAGVNVVGCGRMYSGSAFAIDADHLVTNAHVVAGGRELIVRTTDGRRLDADVVVFDKDRDLALLAVPGHGLPTLAVARAEVGLEGVVIGYPGGQEQPRVAPVRVERWVTGVGRDVYGRDTTERSLVFLAAELRTGDSGAAVVNPAGDVIGVVFAVSPDRADVAYALATDELEALLAAPRTPGETGRCI